jgi:hypothetical protein
MPTLGRSSVLCRKNFERFSGSFKSIFVNLNFYFGGWFTLWFEKTFVDSNFISILENVFVRFQSIFVYSEFDRKTNTAGRSMLLTIVAVIDIATLVSFTIEKNNNFPIFHGIGMFCWKKTLINLNFFYSLFFIGIATFTSEGKIADSFIRW